MSSTRDAFSAAFSGKLSDLKKSAGKLKNLDLHDPTRGTTLMYTAARFGHLPSVKWLVERGASINKKNTDEGSASTPLHGACYGGHHAIVDYLCKLGPTLQENVYGDTPLVDAQNPHDDVKDSDKKKCVQLIKSRKKEIEAELEASDSESEPPVKKQPKKAAQKQTAAKKKPAPESESESSEESAKKPKPKPKAKAKKTAPAPVPDSESESEEEEEAKKPKPKPKPKQKVKTPPTSPDPVKKAKVDDGIEALRKATATLSKVDRDCEEFWDLENKFAGCLQGRNEDYVAARLKKGLKPLTFIVKEIKKVTNPVLEQRYQEYYTCLKKRYPKEKEKWRERNSFHGSAQKNIQSIANTSLLRYKHALNPCKHQSDDGWFGTNKKGVYVSRYAEYTFKYANGGEPLDDGDTCEVIMFKTLPGKSLRIAEVNLGMDPTPGYDSHSSPTYLEWYLFNEAQLCPTYVLKVLAKEDTRTAADDGD